MAQQQSNKTFTNTYKAIPRLVKQGGIIKDEEEKRQIIKTPNNPFFLSRVGQMGMQFQLKDKELSYNGTACVFAVDHNKQNAYAITCAHNLKYFDGLNTYECSVAWFERRQTTQRGLSQTLKQYVVSNQWIHPDYDPSLAVSGHDLAIIQFNDDDMYFEALEGMNGLDPIIEENEDLIHIYGYPVSKEGELWGLSTNTSIVEDTQSCLLQYDVQTSGGQSGAPIIKVMRNTERISDSINIKILNIAICSVFVLMMYCGSLFGFEVGFSFDLAVLAVVVTVIGFIYCDNQWNMKITKQCSIVGIHTTGSDTGNNVGVNIKDSLDWIRKTIPVIKNSDNQDDDDDTVYCLRGFDFSPTPK